MRHGMGFSLAAALGLLGACGPQVTTNPNGSTKPILDDDDYDSPPSLPPEAYGTPEPTPPPTPLTYNLTVEVDWPQSYPLPDTRPLILQVYPADQLSSNGHPLPNALTYVTVRVPGPLSFPAEVRLPLPPDVRYGVVAWIDLTVDSQLDAGDVVGYSNPFIPTSQDVLFVTVSLSGYGS